MSMKHKITINVTKSNGEKTEVLRAADMKLPARLLKFLFGNFTQVYLLAPGQTVDSVDVKEVMEGDIKDEQNESNCCRHCRA